MKERAASLSVSAGDFSGAQYATKKFGITGAAMAAALASIAGLYSRAPLSLQAVVGPIFSRSRKA